MSNVPSIEENGMTLVSKFEDCPLRKQTAQ